MRTKHRDSLGHASLSFVPATPKAFVSLRVMASSWQHGYCNRTTRTVFPCHLLSLRRPQHGLVQTVWVGKTPQQQRDSYGLWLSDSLSSQALTSCEGHHASFPTHKQHSFASRQDIPLEQCQDPTP